MSNTHGTGRPDNGEHWRTIRLDLEAGWPTMKETVKELKKAHRDRLAFERKWIGDRANLFTSVDAALSGIVDLQSADKEAVAYWRRIWTRIWTPIYITGLTLVCNWLFRAFSPP